MALFAGESGLLSDMAGWFWLAKLTSRGVPRGFYGYSGVYSGVGVCRRVDVCMLLKVDVHLRVWRP